MMIALTASVVLARAALLLFATPVTIPSHEPQARRDAAFADYGKTCAPYLQPFIAYAISGGRPRDEAEKNADWGFFMQERMEPGSNTTFASLELLQIRLGRHSSQQDAGARLLRCADEVAIRHTLYGVPGYDHGVGSGGSATPAPSAKATPRPAPAAEKLPPARPAKMAPWSPKAMPAAPDSPLSPAFGPERADALASCAAIIKQYAAHNREDPVVISLLAEQNHLNDSRMSLSVEELQARIRNADRLIAAGDRQPGMIFAYRTLRCVDQRRVAQLEGSPLATGAVDGSLNPMTVGNPGSAWKPQGKDARIIASDGKSAMDCVKLEQIASGDSALSGGGRRLFNYCDGPVEIAWCHAPGDCYGPVGNAWTVQPGRGWPVSSQGEVRWAACHGANTASLVKGSFGLRYYCSAPVKN